MSIINNLRDLIDESPATPGAPRPSQPKKSREPNYAPVENMEPGGAEWLAASMSFFVNDEICSDEQREQALRSLMKMTGRDLAVKPWTVLQQVFSMSSVTAMPLLLAKIFLSGPKNAGSTVYLSATPTITAIAAIVLLILAIKYRRYPDIISTLFNSTIGIMIALAASVYL